METSASGGKRRLKHQVLGDEEETDEDESAEDLAFEDDRSKKVSSSRRGSFGGGASSPPSCQVDNCTADLTYSKTYHKRHKVCEFHAKAPVASITGFQQRFCQQCSRFHALQEFDDTKRSCRRRLAGHNERRRKSSYESQGDGSS